MISFRDIEDNLKLRIWLWIQNGNPDRLKKCQVYDKRQGPTCVWSLVTESIAVLEISESKGWSGIMKNNKDSTEIKKTIKDSEVINCITYLNPSVDTPLFATIAVPPQLYHSPRENIFASNLSWLWMKAVLLV